VKVVLLDCSGLEFDVVLRFGGAKMDLLVGEQCELIERMQIRLLGEMAWLTMDTSLSTGCDRLIWIKD